MKIPLFVINLEKSLDRRKFIEGELNKISLVPTFIKAVDARTYTQAELTEKYGNVINEPLPLTGKPLLKGEVGCMASHLLAYQKIVDEKIEIACVLEDDNQVNEELKFILEEAWLKSFSWEMLLFTHYSSLKNSYRAGGEGTWYSVAQKGKYHVKKAAEHPYSTAGYLITYEGAKKMLQYASPIRMAADIATGSSEVGNVNLFLLSPPCCEPHEEFEKVSTIEDEKYENTTSLARKVVRLTKSWGFAYSLLKQLWFLFRWIRLCPSKLGLFRSYYIRKIF